ncbi:TPA: AAA family ATPase, partial [Candidatus Micrarchaeota archaeon]|nr:AAA family ATPase [Candidatus Micrarchaeota archaeon]
IHTRYMPLAPDVDLGSLAEKTDGYSGADLEALAREAALIALRNDINTSVVEMDDFIEALRKIRPSITPDMMKFYMEWYEKARQHHVAQRRVGPTTYT